MSKNIWIGISYCFAAQILVWLQLNLQFVWPSIKKYNFIMAVVGGTIISYLFLLGTAEIVKGCEGKVWAGRLIPTATGTVVFSIMTWLVLKQGVDLKTGICIFLSFTILAIQIIWK